MARTLYADFNATTPLGEGSKRWMQRAFSEWGNPSSAHRLGRQARKLLDEARQHVARAVGALGSEVVFTSGGSEANNLAIQGAALACGTGFRLLTSGVEHSSIRDLAPWLGRLEAQVERVRLLPSGELDWEHFQKTLTTFKPHLVSLMTANNETGVLFPISDMAALCQERGTLFHTDAVQALGKLPQETWATVPLVSISAHKIYGPKGVGALVVRNGQKLFPTHFGGSQELKRRGGTENLIGIAGFGGACEELVVDTAGLSSLQRVFETRLRQEIPDLKIQGEGAPRLPNTTNVRFPGVTAEVLLGALDLEGICVSAGSACSSGSISPSHVLVEMGLTSEAAKECLRVSWGRTSTLEEVEEVAQVLISQVKRIRGRRS